MCSSGANFSLNTTLQRKSHLCIPRKGISRPQSQFPHSCVCERFLYSQDRFTSFPAAEQADWGLGNSISRNICFEFSVLCLCSVQSNSAFIHKRAIPLDRNYKGDLSCTLFHTLCMSVSNDSWILESQKENGPLLVSFELQRCCTVHTAIQFECLSALQWVIFVMKM